jgi:hypothetical protein
VWRLPGMRLALTGLGLCFLLPFANLGLTLLGRPLGLRAFFLCWVCALVPAAAGIVQVWVARAALVRKLRAADFRFCVNCTYPLIQSLGGGRLPEDGGEGARDSTSGVCPECGTPFELSATRQIWKTRLRIGPPPAQ